MSLRPPDVWYAIPSANPELCRTTLPAWRDMGYRVAVLQNWQAGEIPADLTMWCDAYPGWAASINLLCRNLVPPDAPIVVSGGDDMLPDPSKTAGEIAGEFMERFKGSHGGTFGVMQPTGDSYMSAANYCGSPWLGRAWIDRVYGGRGPMWPGYRHNFADLELYWLARGMNALWLRPDLSQRHEHFFRSGQPKPEYWSANVATRDEHDCRLYLARSFLNFPGHETPGVRFDAGVLREDEARLAERHFAERYAAKHGRADWESRMSGALGRCAAAGMRRVAIYGAGTHTRGVGGALMSPPVQIACIIDDDPALHGTALWGYPVVALHAAASLGIHAIVLSSNTREERLAERCAPLAAAGLPIIRLYDDRAAVWHAVA